METFHKEVHMTPDAQSTATGAPSAVVVFGSINADTSYRMRALPLPGETVLALSAQSSPGGKGANQAIAAAAAGTPTRMVGLVGDDVEARGLLEALGARGVDTGSVSARRGVATGRAIVTVDDHAENAIIVLPGANEQVDASLAQQMLQTLGAHDVLVLQNEIPAEANRAAARIARAAGAAVIWNAAPAPARAADIVDGIDLLVVNEHELMHLAALLGLVDDEATDTGRTDRLLRLTIEALTPPGGPAPAAVCTLGAEGSFYVDGDEAGHTDAPRVHAVDTTAAGDTLVGYLAAHAHLPLAGRLELAGAAGALTVTREGASSSIPPLAEVELLLARLSGRAESADPAHRPVHPTAPARLTDPAHLTERTPA